MYTLDPNEEMIWKKKEQQLPLQQQQQQQHKNNNNNNIDYYNYNKRLIYYTYVYSGMDVKLIKLHTIPYVSTLMVYK